ncbi:MAG: DNA repair protein RadA, partial [Acidimicrobiales bacterium]
WVGRCPACSEWNTLVEELDEPTPVASRLGASIDRAVPIAEVDTDEWQPRSTGLTEVDRVLSGGLVPGSVTLVGGEPGIGKSTLLLQVASAVASAGATVLYVSAEESKQQVRLRAQRLGTLAPRLYLASETALPHLVAHLDEIRPDLLIVDSIQTVYEPELSSAPGSVAQVRECAARLVRQAKARSVSTVLVGHVTKDGGLAGPRVLEHVVDTVLAFEGERHHALRMLRASKHRFGSTDELGLFEMTDTGLAPVPDASGLFLADRRPGVSGSVVVPTIEGHRPLLVEIQALVVGSNLPSPRRSAQGVDSGRLSLLLAVLGRRAGIQVDKADVYALAVGGVVVREPGADLGVALAIASAAIGRALPPDMVVCGEVGLGGELRQVAQSQRRLAEAARLGFTAAIVPRLAPEPPACITALRADDLFDAIALAGLGAAPEPPRVPVAPDPFPETTSHRPSGPPASQGRRLHSLRGSPEK